MTNQDLYDYITANDISSPSGDVFAVGVETEDVHFVDKGGNTLTTLEAVNRYGLVPHQILAFLEAREREVEVPTDPILPDDAPKDPPDANQT